MPETLWDYLARITNGAPGAEIARVVGMDAGTVSRWKTGKARPSMEAAVAIAEKWNRPPVEVLIAAGHLDHAAAGAVVEVGRGLDEWSDAELINAVDRRLKELRDALEAATESSAPATGHKSKEAKSGDDSERPRLGDVEFRIAEFNASVEDGDDVGHSGA